MDSWCTFLFLLAFEGEEKMKDAQSGRPLESSDEMAVHCWKRDSCILVTATLLPRIPCFLLALKGEEMEEGRGPLVTCYEKAELRLKRSAF